MNWLTLGHTWHLNSIEVRQDFGTWYNEILTAYSHGPLNILEGFNPAQSSETVHAIMFGITLYQS